MVKPKNALTLGIDIGGSHLKAAVVDPQVQVVAGPARVVTPKPAAPEAVVSALTGMIAGLGRFDRVSIGFPGVVRGATVLTAPNLGTKAWRGFALADVIARQFGKPVRMLNDGSVQGLGVISGKGVECVLTMGTGMGFALFENGRLAPHLELGQHPVKTHISYDQFVGERALERIGKTQWNKRVRKVIEILVVFTAYDTLYIGGGNSRLIKGKLPPNVKLTSNEAGITGGVRVWDKLLDDSFE